MGKAHAAAQAGIARAQASEQIREAESRRAAAEQQRQLLSNYLGTAEQVNGTGVFSGASPEALKYTQRYAVDQRALSEIQAAGQGIKNQLNPFQSADNNTRGGLSLQDYSAGFANRANDLLAQAEASARAGNLTQAEQLFQQAQQVISGVQPEAQGAYNLSSTPSSAAAIQASSAEGRIVGRQLLTARELGDPNSETSQALRSRLLDPTLQAIGQGEQGALAQITGGEQGAIAQIKAGEQGAIGSISTAEQEALKAVEENTRNAERAIAAERSQIEGQIRQTGTGGGVGVNARAMLALQSQAGSQAALRRASVYSEQGSQEAAIHADVGARIAAIYKESATEQADVLYQSGMARAAILGEASRQRAAVTSQVALYINEFGKRMAEDSVGLAQEWINGTAQVRDIYQESLIRLDQMQAEMTQEFARIFQAKADAIGSQQKNGLASALAGAAGGAAKGSAAGPFGAIVGGILGGIGGYYGSR